MSSNPTANQMRAVAGALGIPLEQLQEAIEKGEPVRLVSAAGDEATAMLSSIGSIMEATPPPPVRYWVRYEPTRSLMRTAQDLRGDGYREVGEGEYFLLVDEAKAEFDRRSREAVEAAVEADRAQAELRQAKLAKLAEATGLNVSDLEGLL